MFPLLTSCQTPTEDACEELDISEFKNTNLNPDTESPHPCTLNFLTDHQDRKKQEAALMGFQEHPEWVDEYQWGSQLEYLGTNSESPLIVRQTMRVAYIRKDHDLLTKIQRAEQQKHPHITSCETSYLLEPSTYRNLCLTDSYLKRLTNGDLKE